MSRQNYVFPAYKLMLLPRIRGEQDILCFLHKSLIRSFATAHLAPFVGLDSSLTSAYKLLETR
jgi:hypothetical protein